MKREYYSDTVPNFLKSTNEEILGKLTLNNDFSLEQTQRDAWLEEIRILKTLYNLTKVQFILNTRFQEWEKGSTLF
jgi:hypothetical protein